MPSLWKVFLFYCVGLCFAVVSHRLEFKDRMNVALYIVLFLIVLLSLYTLFYHRVSSTSTSFPQWNVPSKIIVVSYFPWFELGFYSFIYLDFQVEEKIYKIISQFIFIKNMTGYLFICTFWHLFQFCDQVISI